MIRTAESPLACPHVNVAGLCLQREVFVSLAGLSPREPWIQEVELDLNKTRLPLRVQVGLQYTETLSPEGGRRFSTYFFIENFRLDALHFAEPYREVASGAHSRPPNVNMLFNEQTHKENSADAVAKEVGSEFDCVSCKKKREQDSREPLLFSFDASEIQLVQCISAILADCLPDEKVRAMIQTAKRAAVVVPDICLPGPLVANANANANANASASVNINTVLRTTDTHRVVWITLEERGRDGSVINASLQVKGSNPVRVASVHQALQKRIAALFD